MVSSDPVKLAQENLRETKRQTDILGEMLKIEKNLLQETRAMHITLLELTRIIATSAKFSPGVIDEEDQESQHGPT